MVSLMISVCAQCYHDGSRHDYAVFTVEEPVADGCFQIRVPPPDTGRCGDIARGDEGVWFVKTRAGWRSCVSEDIMAGRVHHPKAKGVILWNESSHGQEGSPYWVSRTNAVVQATKGRSTYSPVPKSEAVTTAHTGTKRKRGTFLDSVSPRKVLKRVEIAEVKVHDESQPQMTTLLPDILFPYCNEDVEGGDTSSYVSMLGTVLDTSNAWTPASASNLQIFEPSPSKPAALYVFGEHFTNEGMLHVSLNFMGDIDISHCNFSAELERSVSNAVIEAFEKRLDIAKRIEMDVRQADAPSFIRQCLVARPPPFTSTAYQRLFNDDNDLDLPPSIRQTEGHSRSASPVSIHSSSSKLDPHHTEDPTANYPSDSERDATEDAEHAASTLHPPKLPTAKPMSPTVTPNDLDEAHGFAFQFTNKIATQRSLFSSQAKSESRAVETRVTEYAAKLESKIQSMELELESLKIVVNEQLEQAKHEREAQRSEKLAVEQLTRELRATRLQHKKEMSELKDLILGLRLPDTSMDRSGLPSDKEVIRAVNNKRSRSPRESPEDEHVRHNPKKLRRSQLPLTTRGGS